MKIGITGCGGFIGSYLSNLLLSKGYKVKGLDNFYKGHCDSLFHVITNPNFEFMYGSVTEQKDCNKFVEGCDAVIHLAAIVGFPQCAKVRILAEQTNHSGTVHMLYARSLYNRKIPFVFASTGSVYGALTEKCTEQSPCNTNTVYGLTKLHAEKAVVAEPNTVTYRFATCFGVSPCMRVQLLVNDFVNKAFNDRIINVFEADFKRTFIHIHDFCRALEFGVLNCENMPEKLYNVGDDKLNWSKRQLAEYISKKTGCHLHFAETGQDADVRNYEVDYNLINSKGFKCEKTMEEGIDELIKAIPLLRIGNRYEPN